MTSRRTLIILAAVVLAAVAAFGVVSYLSSVEARAFNDAKLVRVFVVKKEIPKGTTGEDALSRGMIESENLPQKIRPTTAMVQIGDIRPKVALTTLAPGQVVVDGHFVEPQTAQVTAARIIPSGQVAVTVSIDQTHGVAGLVVPGDKVNIITDDGPNQRVLYQNVTVLFIGKSAAPQPGETQAVQNPGSDLITFAVSPDAAPKIVMAAKRGPLWLTLVPPDYSPTDIPPATPGNLFTGALTADGRRQ